MAKDNGTFRTIRIISIIIAILFTICGTVWALSGRFANHDKRITTLETHIVYIKEAVGRIEKKINE